MHTLLKARAQRNFLPRLCVPILFMAYRYIAVLNKADKVANYKKLPVTGRVPLLISFNFAFNKCCTGTDMSSWSPRLITFRLKDSEMLNEIDAQALPRYVWPAKTTHRNRKSNNKVGLQCSLRNQFYK